MPYEWETRKKYLDLPLSISEYESKLDRIRGSMEKNGVDCLLIFGDSGDAGDLIYVSNSIPFGRAAIVICKEDPPILITDAILPGEPIKSYAWMTWIKEFVHSSVILLSSITSVLGSTPEKRTPLVGSTIPKVILAMSFIHLIQLIRPLDAKSEDVL